MKNRTIAIIILASIAAFHSALFFLPPALYETYFNFFRPLFYVALLTFTLIFYNKKYGVHPTKSTLWQISILGILLFVGANFIFGLFSGFGKNPLSGGAFSFFVTAWSYMTIVVVREILRSKIMLNVPEKRRWLALWVVALILTFSGIDNIANVLGYDWIQAVNWFFITLAPLLLLNLWLCYAAYHGALGSNLLFAGIYFGVQFLSPILPSSPQILTAIANYVIIFVMFIVYDSIEWLNKRKDQTIEIKRPKNYALLIIPGAFLTLCIMFGIGVFPVFPISIISNSMKPEFQRGDLVFIQKIDPDDIGIGDILEYKTPKMDVIHRVIEIGYTAEGKRYFVTKGDNNKVQDIWPVYDEQVRGIAKFVIPKLGYPTLLLEGIK